MIKQTKKQMLMLAAIASIGLTATGVQAQDNDIVITGAGENPYVIDARNVVARSADGLCWRTGYWSPATASTVLAGEFPAACQCDSDIIPQDQCVAPVAVVAEPAPAPAPAPKPTAEKIKLAADALFDFDQATLKPEGRAKLDDLAAKAQDLKLEVILAVGHTDRIGTDAYNQALSERRAAAVKTYLVSKGIEANRVYTEGKGKRQPVTGNQCDNIRNRAALIDCLQPDRRVEVEVIGSK